MFILLYHIIQIFCLRKDKLAVQNCFTVSQSFLFCLLCYDVYEENEYLMKPMQHSGKESTCQYRRHERCGFDPWVGKIPGVGNGNLLQYSCLENFMDRGAWWATIHGNAMSQTQLSNRTCTRSEFYFTKTQVGQRGGQPSKVML